MHTCMYATVYSVLSQMAQKQQIIRFTPQSMRILFDFFFHFPYASIANSNTLTITSFKHYVLNSLLFSPITAENLKVLWKKNEHAGKEPVTIFGNVIFGKPTSAPYNP